MQNDEGLHNMAIQSSNYEDFANDLKLAGYNETGDGFPWIDDSLDHKALDKLTGGNDE